MDDNDKVYYDKKEIEQYELTIKKALEGIKEEYKDDKWIIINGVDKEDGRE